MRCSLSLFVTASLLLACGEAERDGNPPAGNPHVEQFREESGLEFEECGDVWTSTCWEGSCDVEGSCNPERIEAQDCVLAAIESCTPVHYRERTEHASWGWGSLDLFVVPEGGTCSVVVFETERASHFDCNFVVRRDCTEVVRDGDSTVCGLYDVGCGDPIELEGDRRACRM